MGESPNNGIFTFVSGFNEERKAFNQLKLGIYKSAGLWVRNHPMFIRICLKIEYPVPSTGW
jgi:hypothetical protein